MAYDLKVSVIAVLLAIIALLCTIYGMLHGSIPDVLGGIAFALLADFLKWDDPEA